MIAKTGKLLTVFAVGGLSYGLMEVLSRGFTHITMGLLGGICFIIIHIANGERRKGNMPLIVLLLLSAAFITSIEFLSGEILNRLLHMNIWSYSEMPLNYDGQICVPFSMIWFAVSFLGTVTDDFIRHRIFKEERIYAYFAKKRIPAAV